MNKKRILSIVLFLAILLASFQFGLAVDLDHLTQYDMNISLNTKDHTVEGEQKVRFTNTYNTSLDKLVFHLYPDSYESYETLPAIGGMYLMEGEELPKLTEEQKGYININKVYIDEVEAKYTEDNQVLIIEMKELLKKGEEANVKIEFTVKIPEGNHRLHHLGGTYSLTNWYPVISIYDEKAKKWDENPYHPVGESNYSDISDYNMELTVPKKMVVAPTGSIVGEKEDGENKIVSIRAEKVRDFVILTSDKYKLKTREVDGIKISSYYMEAQDNKADTVAEILLDEVAKTVKFMNKTVGKYPYNELRIAETHLGGGAMEYPQVIQMGRYWDLSEVKVEERVPFTIEAAVHETMHQWWYVAVGNNEFEDPFLDESLTVFSTAYYFEKEYGKDQENGVDYVIRNRIYPSSIKSLNSGVDQFEDWGDYSEAIYNRGPAFFEDLRQRVGEEKFVEILKAYYMGYQFQNATMGNLLDVIGNVVGKDIKKDMEEALTKPNYYPENIKLSQEEETAYYKKQRKRSLEQSEQYNGLITGSIILRGLKGEEVIIVKPDYLDEEDSFNVENFIRDLVDSAIMEYDIEMKIVKEKDLTEIEEQGNLILIGYPDKNSVMKDMAPELPINIMGDRIELDGGISIKSEGATGSFIAENPNNKDNLVLVIFLSENKDVGKKIEGTEGVIVYNNRLFSYNPMYGGSGIKFIINVRGIEIRGNADSDAIFF